MTHPDPAFRFADTAAMQAFAAERAFATLAFCAGGRLLVAHAPMVPDGNGNLRFHLARRNPAAGAISGANAVASFAGPDFYVSPDWYGSPDQVPTWNYRAVEAHGRIEPLSPADLIAQLDALSEAQEARLAPKPPWRRDKMSPARFDAMVGGISGFVLIVTEWRGTAKLSQNKTPAQRQGLARALTALGRSDHAALVSGAR